MTPGDVEFTPAATCPQCGRKAITKGPRCGYCGFEMSAHCEIIIAEPVKPTIRKIRTFRKKLPRHPLFGTFVGLLLVLMVGASIVLSWVGYSLNWIHQRQSAIASRTVCTYETLPGKMHTPRPEAPAGLWLFGEKGYVNVRIMANSSVKRILTEEEGKQLFPEAYVHY